MNKKGFTLIELVMVIVILGILAVIALPKFVDLSSTAKLNATKSAAGTIKAAIAIQYANNAVNGSATYPPLAMMNSGSIFADGKIPLNQLTTAGTTFAATYNGNGGWVYYEFASGTIESNDTARTSM